MRLVMLTELGLAVYADGRHEKTFAFSDPVSEYVGTKQGKLIPDGLVDYIHKTQAGVAATDGGLLGALKRKSVDAQMASEEEISRIQSEKPAILVESGLASNEQDAISKLRDFAISLSSSAVTEASASPDLHVIQAINSLDEVDRICNAMSSRLREWYGLHFPELDNVIDSISGYCQIVVGGRRDVLSEKEFQDAGFPDTKVQMLKLVCGKSRGGDISPENLAMVQMMASQLLEMHAMRKKMEDHLEAQMNSVAPNLSIILGTAVGARMLARAGSLKRLASLPASTIQVLGAERALFRALKTGSPPPKHGLLFQHALVHAAPRWQRGKIARAIAAKAVIAARVDVYGQGINETLLAKLNVRVGEIGSKYADPPEPAERPRTEQRGSGRGYGRQRQDDRHSDRRGSGRRGDDRRGRGRGNGGGKKPKKKRRFGRR